MGQKSEVISQVKLREACLRTYCFLVPACCLLISDIWSLITAYLLKWGSYAERPYSLLLAEGEARSSPPLQKRHREIQYHITPFYIDGVGAFFV